jgi:hypothetical protein
MLFFTRVFEWMDGGIEKGMVREAQEDRSIEKNKLLLYFIFNFLLKVLRNNHG